MRFFKAMFVMLNIMKKKIKDTLKIKQENIEVLITKYFMKIVAYQRR